jgi:hypothetical protein
MSLRLKVHGVVPPVVRTERSPDPGGPRRSYALVHGRRVYLAAEVVSTYGAEWTGPAEPAGWDALPALEV